MPLPKIATAIYELKIPTTKKKVKYRPFLVKEQKQLLIAQQGEDVKVMYETLKDIIKACVQDEFFDVEKLSLVDIEYIFLQLRARSVGEISNLTFSCLECNDPKAKSPVAIDLTKIEVKFDPKHHTTIQLTDTIGVKMKYPSIDVVEELKHGGDVSAMFNVIVSCIDEVYDDKAVYKASEFTKDELDEFINQLTQAQYLKIQEFFDTMPKLEKEVEFDCPVCGFHHKQTLRGLESFF